jgi:hypothetical protein
MAYIFQLGQVGQRPDPPVAMKPVNTVHIIDNTPSFTFEIPSDPQSDRIVFCIEMATDLNFTNIVGAIESRFNSVLEIGGYWEYDSTGSNNFVPMSNVGISSLTYAGRKAIASFPPNMKFNPGTYYWRVLVSDEQLNQNHPPYLNQFNNGQEIMGT